MRKILAPALVGIGAFLLIVGILALVWVPGAVKKTPLEVNTLTRLAGEAAKIDPATGSLEPRPIYAMSVTQVDSEASTDDTAVWAQWTCAAFGAGGDCVDPENPNSVLVSEDELVSASDTIFGTDRITAEGLPAEDLPEGVADSGGVTTEGIVNKFPFDAEQRTYPYWDGTIGRSVDAEFDGTEDIEGVETYVYRTSVVDEEIEIAEGTPGTYSSAKTIFVDPVTGSIINQTEEQQRYLADGTQVLELSLGFTQDQISANASDAKSNGSQIALLTTIVPIVGLAGGAVLLILGLLLGRRRGGAAPQQTADRPLVSA